jgi:hypothetical protein
MEEAMQTDEERKAKERERWRRRYADPEERARIKARARECQRIRWASDPEFRRKHIERARRSYQTDPVIRARMLRQNDAYRRRNWERIKARRRAQRSARKAADPAYAAHIREQSRRQRRRQQRQQQREFLAAVREAVPASYPRDVRDDISSEMILAVAERRLQRDRIKEAVQSFIRSYWQRNPRMGFVSLDAPVYAGGPKLVDTIAGDLSSAASS